MSNDSKRRELIKEYKQTSPEAGVYRIICKVTGRYRLSRSVNLRGVEGKLSFAKSTGCEPFMDKNLAAEMMEHGATSFEFEIVELLEIKPDMSKKQIDDELIALEELCRERLGTESEIDR